MNPELPSEKPPADKPINEPQEKSDDKPIASQPEQKVESHAPLPVPLAANVPASDAVIPPVVLPQAAPPQATAPLVPSAEPVRSKPSQPTLDDVGRQLRRVSRRSFAVAGGAAAVGFGGWYWLRTRSEDAGIPWPLRRALEFNAALAQAYFKDSRLAPTFAPDRAIEPRVNGELGLGDNFDVAHWKLRVETPARKDVQEFNLDQIRALPRAEMVTELKCIEGWSEVVQWAGARLADFVTKHGLGQRDGKSMFDYVQLECPGGGYYVGLEMASAMHPQTLLCYEMNGKPLTAGHGAPLRLVIPVKYGIKNIKRIGTMRFLDVRPADYWAERGYDWYAGL